MGLLLSFDLYFSSIDQQDVHFSLFPINSLISFDQIL